MPKKDFKYIYVLGVTAAIAGIYLVITSMASLLSFDSSPDALLFEKVTIERKLDSHEQHISAFHAPDIRLYGDGLLVCGTNSGIGSEYSYTLKQGSLDSVAVTNFVSAVKSSGFFELPNTVPNKPHFNNDERVFITANVGQAKNVSFLRDANSKELDLLNNLTNKLCANVSAEFVPDSIELFTKEYLGPKLSEELIVNALPDILFSPDHNSTIFKDDVAKTIYKKFKKKKSIFIKSSANNGSVFEVAVSPILRQITPLSFAEHNNKNVVYAQQAKKPVKVIRMRARDQADAVYQSMPGGAAGCATVRAFYNTHTGRVINCVPTPVDNVPDSTYDRIGAHDVATYKSVTYCQSESAAIVREYSDVTPGDCSDMKGRLWTTTFREFFTPGHATMVLLPFGSGCGGLGFGDGTTDSYAIGANMDECPKTARGLSKGSVMAHELGHNFSLTHDNTTINNIMSSPAACGSGTFSACSLTTGQINKLKQSAYFFQEGDPDTTRPSNPPNLEARRQTKHRILLRWDLAQDNSRVIDRYFIYAREVTDQNSSPPAEDYDYIGSTDGENFYEAHGLTADRWHSFYVTARDLAGNESYDPDSGQGSYPSRKNYKTARTQDAYEDRIDEIYRTADSIRP